ncbi:hypothetical protein PJK45_28870, partial [Mycobacterium kansasii]
MGAHPAVATANAIEASSPTSSASTPPHCPRCGGALGAGQVLVGVAQCGCGTMHRTHTCRGCQEKIYTPPLGNSCLLQSLDDRNRRA